MTDEKFWDRFWAKVQKTETCWVWTASTTRGGYGNFGPSGKGRTRYVHRLAYEHLRGPIPSGLSLDHLCNNRRCVNPDHLEPVTHQVNVSRGVSRRTHCANGHEYNESNTGTRTSRGRSSRECRTCKSDRDRRYNQQTRKKVQR